MTVLQSSVSDKYELVVGLEVHAQLSTSSKAFSSDSAAFGAGPNEHVSPVSLGHPGTLPRINKKMVEYAVKMGLACNCAINLQNTFARKNYFYADLPKGYQTTQDQQPICLGGAVTVKLTDGTSKKIAIHHIHMEDDAGKSSHDQHDHYSLIDLNRAGVPLIEIVSEPDLRSAEEAGQFLTEIRRLLRYLDICDGNMEEGSMRCDANISVRLRGAAQYGNRCEVKNLNSIRNVQRAIEHEFARQVDVIEAGGHIDQNTLNFNADTGETSVLRSKEMANDYRYFPEPDLLPVQLTEAYVAQVRDSMPALPNQLFEKYTTKLGLSDYDAGVIIADKEFAAYFEELIKHTANYKSAANWVMGSVRSYINDNNINISNIGLEPAVLAGLIQLVDDGKVNNSVAAQKLFPVLAKGAGKTASQLAAELNLLISEDTNEVDGFINAALAKYPDKVKEYQKGKKGVLGLFMGEVMKLSKGKDRPTKNQPATIKRIRIQINMKNRLITGIAVTAMFFIASCKQSTTFTISGKLDNPGPIKKVYLLVADSTQVNIIDSTTLGTNNEFQFKHSTPYANLYKLRIGGNVYDVVAQNGDAISFKTDIANAKHDYEISGSETSEKIKEFNRISNVYGEKSSKLSDEYTTKSAALGKESDSLLKIYIPQFQKNINEYSGEVLKFVDQNKKSLAGFFAATSLDQYKYEQQLVAYADDIKDDFKDNPAVQNFLHQMAAIKPVSVGHKAPEFTINSIDGKQVKLTDYKGKYVMLDFWASWCGPCRQENPNVVKQYNLYKDKGFNILGVSLDIEKKDWQQAVNADKLTWTHVSDLQRFEGPTERLYHIDAIPSNFIIDPQGVIVAKNVTGADLEEFLKKTFK